MNWHLSRSFRYRQVMSLFFQGGGRERPEVLIHSRNTAQCPGIMICTRDDLWRGPTSVFLPWISWEKQINYLPEQRLEWGKRGAKFKYVHTLRLCKNLEFYTVGTSLASSLICPCVHLASHFISINHEKELGYKLSAADEFRIWIKLNEPLKS